MPWLSVEHHPQETPAGCLAACAQMALAHLGITQSQRRLNRLLGLTSIGIPLSHIQRLAGRGVNVLLESGDEAHIKQAIDRGLPPIAFVRTGDLPYWAEDIDHAVLVVGYDDVDLYLNDPAFPDAPQRVPWDNFLLAWDEFDSVYALLTH